MPVVGTDFDPSFLTWLFDTASSILQSAEPAPAPSAPASGTRRPDGGNRMLTNALSASHQDSYKRKADTNDAPNKRRISEGTPSGPRAMGNEGRSLQSRIGRPMPAPMAVRGAAQTHQQHPPPNGPRPHNNFQTRQPVFPNMFPPGQQEMMAQMMMMQASMAQMGEMMNHMIQVCLQFCAG
jgi:uncharacterized membrane protein